MIAKLVHVVNGVQSDFDTSLPLASGEQLNQIRITDTTIYLLVVQPGPIWTIYYRSKDPLLTTWTNLLLLPGIHTGGAFVNVIVSNKDEVIVTSSAAGNTYAKIWTSSGGWQNLNSDGTIVVSSFSPAFFIGPQNTIPCWQSDTSIKLWDHQNITTLTNLPYPPNIPVTGGDAWYLKAAGLVGNSTTDLYAIQSDFGIAELPRPENFLTHIVHWDGISWGTRILFSDTREEGTNLDAMAAPTGLDQSFHSVLAVWDPSRPVNIPLSSLLTITKLLKAGTTRSGLRWNTSTGEWTYQDSTSKVLGDHLPKPLLKGMPLADQITTVSEYSPNTLLDPLGVTLSGAYYTWPAAYPQVVQFKDGNSLINTSVGIQF